MSKLAIEGGRPVRREFLPFGVPSLGEEEIEEVVATLRSGWIGQGKRVERFEREFGEAFDAPYAVAVSSCTAAMHLALVVGGIGPGDEVLVPAMTFAATATAVEHAHGTPVFCDVDPATLLLDLDDFERRITKRTKAVIPVHFGGLPIDMDALSDLATRHGLFIVEDAAHAVGTSLDGRSVGSFDSFACFSFYPNKNLTTGEGGMVTTRDEAHAERLRMLRLHGLSTDAWRRYATRSYVPSELYALGFKYNLTDLSAAIGIHQLAKLERHQQRREELAVRYDAAFESIDVVHVQPRGVPGHDVRHALHLYLLLLDVDRLRATRNEIVAALREEGIGAAIHYRALHLEPYFAERFGHPWGAFPHAAGASDRVLTLPLSPGMSDEDADDVIAATEKVIAAYAAD